MLRYLKVGIDCRVQARPMHLPRDSELQLLYGWQVWMRLAPSFLPSSRFVWHFGPEIISMDFCALFASPATTVGTIDFGGAFCACAMAAHSLCSANESLCGAIMCLFGRLFGWPLR